MLLIERRGGRGIQGGYATAPRKKHRGRRWGGGGEVRG